MRRHFGGVPRFVAKYDRGEGGVNFTPKLRDVIYGWALKTVKFSWWERVRTRSSCRREGPVKQKPRVFELHQYTHRCRMHVSIFRTVLWCVVYDSWYAHMYDQFLKMSVGLGLDLVFPRFVTSHSCQLSLLPSAWRKMSTQPMCGDVLRLGRKAGIVHSTCRWACGWQVKLCDPSLTCAIPQRLREEFLMIKRYTNLRLLTYLPI